MVDIKRYNSSVCEVFSITNNSGNLKLFTFYDNDLRFTCDDLENFTYSIEICPDDSYFYTLVDEVYDAVSNRQPFKYLKCDFDDNDLVFSGTVSNSKSLFKNGVIEWHSDDFSYDAASVLKIEKNSETDNFIVSFYKSKLSFDDIGAFSTNSVKIGTGESRYSPYNAAFIDMYKKMCNYCEQRGHTFSNSKFGRRRVRTR